MNNHRPDPDQLLTHVQWDDAQEKRGKLKIFLGYAAGVGKTYAMLEAAQQRRAAGVDVVVGYVETHGRAETDALLAGLERIPRQKIAYRGITLSEMDTDAILQRQPKIALVDELAHSNAPGSRHLRRYQDVLELLNSGIDVYTTVNIQHLESLNDVVSQVTGVTVQETVPDHILDEAHEIKLVDLPIDELLARLEAGKVYVPAQAERALRKFFRPGNLTALRELTLRRAADRIDEQMRAYMQTHAIPGPWPVGERLLVCVSPSPLSERLVRTTRRLARRLDAEWIAAYVETDTRLSDADQERVDINLRLAEELGAQTVRLAGHSVAETLTDYALSRNVTKIVAGKPLRTRWQEWLQGSLIDQILRRSQDMDVYVINGRVKQAEPPASQWLSANQPFAWRTYGFSAGLVLLATVVGLPLRPFVTPTNLIMLYLVVVMLAAVRLGHWPAIAASLLSVIAFDVVFVPPYYTFAVADAEYLLTFAGLLAVGLVISTLAARAQGQALAARRREAQTAAVYELSKRLANASSQTDIAQTTVQHLLATFNSPAAIFLPDETEEHLILQASTSGFVLDTDDAAVADWVFRDGQPAGRYTDTLTGVNGYYMPLQTAGQVIGVMSIEFSDDTRHSFADEQRHLLNSFSNQVAVALERSRLADQERRAQLLQETEKLQTTLLNSISHDLRTPLATITGALSSLRDDEAVLDAASRRDLTATAWEESERMNWLVGNLLDMTRLEAGALHMAQDPCDVQDLIGVSLSRLGRRLQDRPVYLDIEEDLPLIPGDFVLLVQVLVNLLDNALKYSASATPIDLSACLVHESSEAVAAMEIAVADRGSGIPPEQLEAIFGKFYQVSPHSSTPGTGLGLSICRGIVEAHGGKIWAQNRMGGGTVVVVRLPLDLPGESAPIRSVVKGAAA